MVVHAAVGRRLPVGLRPQRFDLVGGRRKEIARNEPSDTDGRVGHTEPAGQRRRGELARLVDDDVRWVGVRDGEQVVVHRRCGQCGEKGREHVTAPFPCRLARHVRPAFTEAPHPRRLIDACAHRFDTGRPQQQLGVGTGAPTRRGGHVPAACARPGASAGCGRRRASRSRVSACQLPGVGEGGTVNSWTIPLAAWAVRSEGLGMKQTRAYRPGESASASRSIHPDSPGDKKEMPPTPW